MVAGEIGGAAVDGIVTVVPETCVSFEEDAVRLNIGESQAKRIARSVGLKKRHVAPIGVTATDLGHAAVVELIEGLAASIDDIGALIFVTQTPDFPQPCNAAVLHGRLGLKPSVCAFDINLGCSGYVYGLFVASNLVASLQTRVLLVVGDTLSRVCAPGDRSTSILFGDAASATILSPNCDTKSVYDFGTDGKGYDSIIVPAGGARQPVSPESGTICADEDGNLRSLNDLHMNGGEVFNFASRTEPRAIKQLLDSAETGVEEIDYFFLHQANKYIIQTIAKRLKIPRDKVPDTIISNYGNQSSASVPCAINATLQSNEKVKAVLSGFGVGLSWGSVLCDLNLKFCPLPIIWRGK